MSKRAEEAALKAYPEDLEAGYFDDPDEVTDDNEEAMEYFQQGYEQAEKDTIERIREQVKRWMPEKDGEEHTYGERLAFNSVLHLLEEMEGEKIDKATKVAVEKYPHGTFDGELGDSLRAACAVGYMQAEKDITERARFSSGMDGFYYGRGYKQAEKDVWDRIEKYLSNRNPTDYATVGWILKNIEEYKNNIMKEK